MPDRQKCYAVERRIGNVVVTEVQVAQGGDGIAVQSVRENSQHPVVGGCSPFCIGDLLRCSPYDRGRYRRQRRFAGSNMSAGKGEGSDD